MRIGINGSSLIATGAPLKQMVDHAVEAEAHGFSSYWLAQLGVPDTLTAIAAMGARTETIEIGTAVVPTWLRHPLMLASQALTVQEAIGNRLTLGIGLAHKTPIETTLGIRFDRPAKHMKEYLDVLLPAVSQRSVDVSGDIWSAHVPTFGGMPGATTPSVMLAAMGPRMLALAGARTDGLILWLSGPRTIESLLKPAVDAAAAEAGRPMPRIVASVPVCVTNRGDEVRNLIATFLAGYNDLPSYRGVMDIEGVDGPAGVSIVGTESEVRAGVAAFAEAGATDFAAVEFTMDDSEQGATRALLKELARAAR
jgi:5,10-methylenetetrahydromethanopterin reductase